MNDLSSTVALPDHIAEIDAICALDWVALDAAALSSVAWAYYYFSIQFRENLEIASSLHPDDALLTRLMREECDTDNLSPWPGIAAPGERMNHDEFMRRLLGLSVTDPVEQARVDMLGRDYLGDVRAQEPEVRAASIATYEDGGLERVFSAILRNPNWDTESLAAFRHFLLKHIGFDSNPDEGHGALARHLAPDYRVRRLWQDFYDLFVGAAPRLLGPAPD